MAGRPDAGIADLVGELAPRSRDETLVVGAAVRPYSGGSSDAVTKDALWPAPDWRALVASGTESRAAALIKVIRDRIPARPHARVGQIGAHYAAQRVRDPDLVRRDYARMVTAVRDAFMPARTVADVRSARGAAMHAVGWNPSASADTRHIVTSVWRDRTDTLQVDYRDLARIEALVVDGWPEIGPPSWRRGFVVRSDGQGGHLLAKGIKIVADGFASEADAWEWRRQDAAAQTPERSPFPVRPRLDRPVREGLPPRRDGSVHAQGLLDTFGLKAVEFGKWVPQHERQSLLDAVYDALGDLASALGLPPAALGLEGTLALSIGGRASGGAGAAYEAEENVIALPRASGAGELARCWAMAFDNWAGRAGLPQAVRKAACVTGRHDSRPGLPTLNTDHLRGEEAAAWSHLTASLWRSDPQASCQARTSAAELARKEAEVAEAERQRDSFLRRSADAGSPAAEAYLAELDRWLALRRTRVIPEHRLKLKRASARDAAAGGSAYAEQARRLCGRDGDVWLRPGEMFARAFECMVSDRLAEQGGRSEFLVHGVEEGRFASGWRGDPYPNGAERRRISDAAAAVVASMSDRLAPAAQAICEPEQITSRDPTAP